jgi:DhnA family fructose-bisphosphate aldolase class Ia
MRRIFNAITGRTLVIPLDHAITMGPGNGLENPNAIIGAAVDGGADAVMLRPGIARCLAEPGAERLGVIMALTGRLAAGVDHVQLNTVEHAVALGADAVCGEFKFGSDGDLENVRFIALLAERAHDMGIPVLVTVYTRPEAEARLGRGAFAHACRVAQEVGADFVKTSLPDDEEIIDECVAATSVPIILAGGPSGDTASLREFLGRAGRLGIGGAAIGRRAWAADKPADVIRELSAAVHGGDDD